MRKKMVTKGVTGLEDSSNSFKEELEMDDDEDPFAGLHSTSDEE
jgi:hypothetical protein